jgi:prepilin-type N-terminal cleavage/methylation domain-containing protein
MKTVINSAGGIPPGSPDEGASRLRPCGWLAVSSHPPVLSRNGTSAKGVGGFTLVEVVIALAIITLFFNGIITAYVQASRSAEWAGYSLAAQAIGIQQIEQARSGVWDYSISKNDLTNLNLLSWSYNTTTRVGTGYTTSVLDVPISGTNVVVVTNFVTVKTLNLTGFTNVQVQMVAVDTVWPFFTRSGTRLFTNRTASYFGPDNRDATSL